MSKSTRFATVLVALLGFGVAQRGIAQDATPPRPNAVKNEETCLTCHFGIEEMHPWESLTCTACHGGNGKAETRELAHVKPKKPLPNDERVLPLDWADLDYLRFKNPSNLRVLDQTCGGCHHGLCENFSRSLHGTTAGHLSDGMYECGVFPTRGSRFAMFDTKSANPVAGTAEAAGSDKKSQPSFSVLPDHLLALPAFDATKPRDQFATHYLDLAPKNCVRCHFYSTGQALRGRLGFDGDYRSEGCAGCHVVYADNGLSQSGDPTVNKFEPGHPSHHRLTSAIPTENCTHCHYGDASVGLNFRGLAQLYPGQPAGPEVKGTTSAQQNRAFYNNDPNLCPPDIHHEKGMACIDCHTVKDVMGDGALYGQMPQAIEIECSDCHGTFEQPSNLKTSRGSPIKNLVKEGASYFLVSKVTGEKHEVKQAAYIVNPRHPDYNARAAEAMTSAHGRLECYTCHAAWSPNFFGFQFERQEQFTQLDMMSGERTIGRVNTQEKVFATMRGLYLGFNSDKMIAPYLVGFSSMGSVSDAQGKTVLDQVMPVTGAGMSGMTLIHHQLHTTRKVARDCVDCHRNPVALGLGSPNANFHLARNFFFVGSSRGMDVFGIDRKKLSDSTPLANVPELGVVDIALECDPLQGFAKVAYLACASRGVDVVDLSNPGIPKEKKFLKLDDAQSVVKAADRFYVAMGKRGLAIYDVADPLDPKPLSELKLKDARDLVLEWPHLFVADYEEGLVVVDVTNSREPKVASKLSFFEQGEVGADSNLARQIAILQLPSRPSTGSALEMRSQMQILVGLACEANGFKVADVTDPTHPVPLLGYGALGGRVGRNQVGKTTVTGVAAGMHVDLGSPDGAIKTVENDYFYVTVASQNAAQGRLAVVKATNPYKPEIVGTARLSSDCRNVSLMHLFNPPFLQTYAVVTSGALLEIIDVSKSKEPMGVAQFAGMRGAVATAIETFPLDRLIDESGAPQKDISHDGSRYFTRLEVDRILKVPLDRKPIPTGPTTGEDGRGPPNPRQKPNSNPNKKQDGQ